MLRFGRNHPRGFVGRSWIASLLIHAVSTAHATEPTEGDSAPERGGVPADEELSVTVRDEAAPSQADLNVPRMHAQVSREALRRRSPKSLSDALRGSPGVSVQQTTPGQGTISVRGLSGRAVVYVVDGIRLNSAIFRAGNNPYLGLIDPYALESVTVRAGADSVAYGSDALGGAVLMNTGTPGFHVGEPALSLRVHQSLTSNPLGTASRVQFLRQSERSVFTLGMTYYQAGPIEPGEGTASPDPRAFLNLERPATGEYTAPTIHTERGTEFELYAADAALRHRLGRGTELVLRGQGAFRPELVRYDQVTPRFKLTRPENVEAMLDPLYRAAASAALVRRAEAAWYDELALALSWQRLSERDINRGYAEQCWVGSSVLETEDACPERWRLVPEEFRTIDASRSDAFGLLGTARGQSAGRTLSGHAGFEARYDRVGSSAERIEVATGRSEIASPRFPNGSGQGELGVFGDLGLALHERVQVHAGARVSGFFLDVKARPASTGTATPSFREALFDGAAEVGIGLMLVPGLDWVASAGRGVRTPNINDFSALGARARNRYQLPNPDIEPEHSLTVDSGFRFQRGRHRVATSVFHVRYEDAIVLVPSTLNGEAFSPGGDRYYQSINAASVELFGIESTLELALGRRWSVFGSALAMIGTQRNPDGLDLPPETPADRVPPHQGEAGLRLAVSDAVTFETFVLGRLAQKRLNDPVNLDDNRIPEGGTPGYLTWHARATYRPAKDLTFRALFDNLTDELALDHGSGFYLPGFSATASVDLTWR